MEKSTIKTAMFECERAIRSLKFKPTPQDMVTIGELVNYWLKSYYLLTLKTTTNNEKEENNEQ